MAAIPLRAARSRRVSPKSAKGALPPALTVYTPSENIKLRVSPDFTTTAGGRHMDKKKKETPEERGDELYLAVIHGYPRGNRYVSFPRHLSLISSVHFDSL
ncbi:hypothetical protein Y032_0041g439 [Ancylostoma ceylanicum]|uniref:Uncharacterized protein n=1 Tax=Ancylostoma ceylanicum TaxID=53326 RepID=A0A016UH77_9BILA|nr:hypothetical protein Y032_0041g439 [Ancylostoma ceylanicum]